MSPLEIILIILGIIVIIISCRMIDQNASSEHHKSNRIYSLDEQLTEEELKLIKDKMNELLADVSEEAVIKTDDFLSKISNEKIMAVSEYSEQILEKINRNHEEVVFLYNMLSEKEKELKSAMKDIVTSKKIAQDIMEDKHKEEKNKTVQEKEITTETSELFVLNDSNTNNNAQILSLHNRGKSIVEISKLLGLGQGEVKLVIDLFRGKK